MKLFYATFSLLILAATNVVASEPAWVKKTPKQDGEYKYYVGRSMPSVNSLEANNSADKNAREQAVRDNFGATLKIDSTLVDSNYSSNSTSRIEESSKRVNLIGFEFVEDYLEETESDKSKLQTKHILYKYAISEIELEKKRLLTLVSQEPTLSSTGSASDCVNEMNTDLIITSSERNSAIYINNKRIGETPFQIKCKLPAGVQLELKLETKSFKTHTEKISLLQGSPRTVNVILQPEFGSIIFKTNPSGAEIFVNGKNVGVSPTSPVEFQLGIPKEVIFTHPLTEKLTQEVVLDTNSDQTEERTFKLPPKFGKFSFTTKPEAAAVYLNDSQTSIGETPLSNIPCEFGTAQLLIKKDDFKDETQEFECNSQKTEVNAIVLSERPRLQGLHELSLGYDTPNYKGIEVSKFTANYFYSNQIGQSFLRYRLGLSYGAGTNTFTDSVLTQKTAKVSFALPMFVRFYKDRFIIDLSPEAQTSKSFFYAKYNSGLESKVVEYSQFSYGLSLGTYFSSGKMSWVIRAGSFTNMDSGEIKGSSNINFLIGLGF